MDVIWTAGAGQQLQEVFEHLEDRQEGSGESLLANVDRELSLLKSQPHLGSYFEKPVRKWNVAGRYGLIYSPEGRGLVILAFVDMRSDLQPLRQRMQEWFGKL